MPRLHQVLASIQKKKKKKGKEGEEEEGRKNEKERRKEHLGKEDGLQFIL